MSKRYAVNLEVRQCRTCRAPILWAYPLKEEARELHGKAMPLDAKPLKVEEVEGRKAFVLDRDSAKGGIETVERTLLPAENVTYHLSHFATCPDADEHRRSA